MLKILQAKLQQYGNWELPEVQVGIRNGRVTKDQTPTSTGSSKKQESSRKTFTSTLLTTPTTLTVWITTNCGKFLKRWEYQTTWPASWEICMDAKKQQLELDMEQQSAYLTYMKSTSWEMLDLKKHKLESRLLGEISITSDMETQAGIKIAGRNINNLRYADDTTLMAESEEELRNLLMKVKEESEKAVKPVNLKGIQSWIFIGRTDAEAEVPVLWPPDVKNWLIGKKTWCWERLKAGGKGDDRG